MGITPLQFKQLQERAAGKRRTTSPVLEVTPADVNHKPMNEGEAWERVQVVRVAEQIRKGAATRSMNGLDH